MELENFDQSHPVMLAYCKTVRRSFPLIMIVGREPNRESGSAINIIGGIPFDKIIEHPQTKEKIHLSKCGLWNISFATYGSITGFGNTSSVKQLFRSKNSAPLLITDAFPKAISNRVGNKDSLRITCTEAEIEAHVKNVFSHVELIKRVKLIILSGFKANQAFTTSEKNFRENAELNSIPIIKVPFMYGTNSKGIHEAIYASETAEIFKEVHADFCRP